MPGKPPRSGAGAHKEPVPHPRGLFRVSRAAATRTTGASQAPRGFVQEQVWEAGWEKAHCLPDVAPLGGLEAHAVPQPAESGCAHRISARGLGLRDSGREVRAGPVGPGAAQGLEVNWELPFHARC